MTVFVRRLRVTDLPALDEIETAQAPHFPSRVAWLESFRRLVEHMLSEEPEGLMIAEVDDKVVGWAAVRQRNVHHFTGKRYGHILHMSVAEPYRNKKVGTRLLREAEAYLRSRGCESVHLSMPIDNPDVVRVFQRAGYKLFAWELERSFPPLPAK